MEATREVNWLRGFFEEVGRPISGPTLLREDNQSSISIAKDPTHRNRTKHTLLRFNYVREQVRQGIIEIEYIDTTKMPADGLTKPLPGPKHRNFLSLLGLEEPYG